MLTHDVCYQACRSQALDEPSAEIFGRLCVGVREHNVDIIAFRLTATVSVEFNFNSRKKVLGPMKRGMKYIPAGNGTDTTRLQGVKMIHDRGMDGFNFFARYTVRALAQGFGSSPSNGSARPCEIVAQPKCDTNVHIGTFAALYGRKASVDLIVSLEIAKGTQTAVVQRSRRVRSNAMDSGE